MKNFFIVIFMLIFVPLFVFSLLMVVTYIVKVGIKESPFIQLFIINSLSLGIFFLWGLRWGRNSMKEEFFTALELGKDKEVNKIEDFTVIPFGERPLLRGAGRGVIIGPKRKFGRYIYKRGAYITIPIPIINREIEFSVRRIFIGLFVISLLTMTLKDWKFITIDRSSWYPYQNAIDVLLGGLTLWGWSPLLNLITDSILVAVSFFSGYKLGKYIIKNKFVNNTIERIDDYLVIPITHEYLFAHQYAFPSWEIIKLIKETEVVNKMLREIKENIEE